MKREDVKNVMKAEPFKPFVLRMVSGREYRVGHPENVMVPADTGARTIAVYEPTTGATSLLELALVEAIEPDDPGRSNGRRKKSA